MTDYVGKWSKSPDWTPARQANAQRLLTACNALEAIAVKAGIIFRVNQRTTWKYGKRGIPYVHIEVGHAAQNVLLTAVALNPGAAVVGAFDDSRVAELLGLSRAETPLHLLPVGQAAT